MARDQQSLGHQRLQGPAQGRARYAQFHRQFALGRQAVAGLQRAFEDTGFEFSGDDIGQALGGWHGGSWCSGQTAGCYHN